VAGQAQVELLLVAVDPVMQIEEAEEVIQEYL
jgi:hypothetical protein